MGATRLADQLDTSSGSWELQNDVLLFSCKPGSYHRRSEANENIALSRRLLLSFSIPLVIDLRLIQGMNNQAKQIYSHPKTLERISSVAIVVGGYQSQLIGSFLFKLNESNLPVDLFNDLAAAILWSRQA